MTFFDKLKESVLEAVAHAKGKIKLKETDPDCPFCQGRGWYRDESRDSQGNYDYRSVKCEECFTE
jgi:hypothetical protein